MVMTYIYSTGLLTAITVSRKLPPKMPGGTRFAVSTLSICGILVLGSAVSRKVSSNSTGMDHLIWPNKTFSSD